MHQEKETGFCRDGTNPLGDVTEGSHGLEQILHSPWAGHVIVRLVSEGLVGRP